MPYSRSKARRIRPQTPARSFFFRLSTLCSAAQRLKKMRQNRTGCICGFCILALRGGAGAYPYEILRCTLYGFAAKNVKSAPAFFSTAAFQFWLSCQNPAGRPIFSTCPRPNSSVRRQIYRQNRTAAGNFVVLCVLQRSCIQGLMIFW